MDLLSGTALGANLQYVQLCEHRLYNTGTMVAQLDSPIQYVFEVHRCKLLHVIGAPEI